ncbi:TetR/AcrR family transcriptional regulator [Plantactinospora sp. S1510]|uniref:TetR/AcrR family transcriptional regulator n=1 Tax=Plantactinospora alkalitolerans TaxID=2789879 RepID=A0ABS0GU70_9ACTN|nr:TetR/AcrR family transcriptional regulator [Plantactinospora alkalitolerans]MBF9129616.1 TetR/AcrR family transcriptional regulator [Plantactinospora alkalitolerans]
MAGELRGQLLSRAVDHIAEHGVGALTLRGLAAGIGTSHRMLIYHFGSKEGLLVEVVREVESRQRAALTTLDLDPANSLADTIRAMWRRLADPALWPYERLFFEMYGQAVQGHPGTAPLLEGVVDNWLDLNVELAARWDVPAEVARTHARLGLAVIRGLLLDLLATGDRAGTDAALETFAAGYEAGLPIAGPDGITAGRR